MQFGYFDDAAREYVITDPRTPVKWINYIGTLAFGGFVDHTGGALICRNDPTFNRITKYIQQLPASDFKGETLYLRIRRPEGWIVFSPFFVPSLDIYDRFECHVGLGYTRILSEFYGLRTEVTIFVPPGEPCELRDIRVTNLTDAPLEVDAIPVVEYTHPDALKQFTNADWVPQTMQSRAVRTGGRVVLLQYPFMYCDTRVNYFTSDCAASSFETDRACFLGDHEYGTWARPRALQCEQLGNSQALRGDNIAALLHPLGRLEPGAMTRLVIQLGQEASLEAALPRIERFRTHQAVDEAFAGLGRFWNDYLSALQVQTPDAQMNSLLNIHNPRQCYVTKTWSRYLSYYQLGLGSRGIGFRDSSQDVLAVLAAAPAEGRDFIRLLLGTQKRDGSAMHEFNPLTRLASEGDSRERDDRPHYYSDDALWAVLAVTAYLKETGDLDFLKESVPFYEKDRQEQPVETAAVLEHLRRALAFTKGDTGAHGLPRLGFADWNDTINLPAGAESLFTANLYGKALLEMIALFEHIDRPAEAETYREDHAAMRARVEACAWDGDWYVGYFDADGQPLGSARNRSGQIQLNAQTWPVLSGFASPERAEQAMESARRRLNTKYGLKLSTPGYDGYDPAIGGVTTFPPGAKENGGIFLHPNPWAVIAEALLGHGDQAYAYYAQINPAAKNDSLDVYECEPYVYAQNILGDEHPQFGLGRNSWLSGTASWAYQAATQYILGLRPEYAGLRVDPCLPSGWEGFSAVRRFRGRTFRIVVHNPVRVCRGVVRISVDGREVDGNLLPPGLQGPDHDVEVWLGR